MSPSACPARSCQLFCSLAHLASIWLYRSACLGSGPPEAESGSAWVGQGDLPKPIYHVPHFANKTGTLAVYQPKGSWRNPQKRQWKKVEAWDHTQA